eukprot:7072953-Ditylum_brightwellii.AAC.1
MAVRCFVVMSFVHPMKSSTNFSSRSAAFPSGGGTSAKTSRRCCITSRDVLELVQNYWGGLSLPNLDAEWHNQFHFVE